MGIRSRIAGGILGGMRGGMNRIGRASARSGGRIGTMAKSLGEMGKAVGDLIEAFADLYNQMIDVIKNTNLGSSGREEASDAMQGLFDNVVGAFEFAIESATNDYIVEEIMNMGPEAFLGAAWNGTQAGEDVQFSKGAMKYQGVLDEIDGILSELRDVADEYWDRFNTATGGVTS